MIKAILIDDEKNALEMLEWQLQQYCPQITIVAQCRSAAEGIEAIREHRPELIFLDIEMPKQNGFELLESFPEPDFNVIFTTAYDKFAIKAFKYAALDFLLKPIDADDLTATIERYQKKRSSVERSKIELLLQQLQPKRMQKIPLPTQDGILFVQPDDIVHFESSSNYCRIHFLNKQKLLIAKTLKEVEELLKEHSFYRVHNSHLINLSHISRYVKADGGYIEMVDGSNITISRQKKDEFVTLLLKQHGS
jgi:two-component system LytT family response regulator